MNNWYIIEINGEYFAEKFVDLPHSGKQKILFRDFNGDVLSLGFDKKWAQDLINTKNEIDNYI